MIITVNDIAINKIKFFDNFTLLTVSFSVPTHQSSYFAEFEINNSNNYFIFKGLNVKEESTESLQQLEDLLVNQLEVILANITEYEEIHFDILYQKLS
ncbi:hypothetical protein ACQCVK_10610 [Rossellomorea vietnamensis]|uniref:hypothetical protein n=1 Tax=Rossellomorea vietnamensis TaxID=218284 RepID=UPI003CF11A0D